ncbi:MAG: H-type lectin domain-containing protein [Ignavibacteria bacterium]|nr:H-type lectin domain-containing protein [Ignavibacteria bacterium]
MKRNAFILILSMLVLSAFAFSQNTQKGDFRGDGKVEGWTLGEGTGSRSAIIFVKFDKPFSETPTVLVAVTGQSSMAGETAKKTNFNVTADRVTRDGFVIKVSTWDDTKLLAVYGSWLAMGK